MSSPSVTASSKKRNHLPLERKVAVIREAENSPGTNLRKLSRMFGCGKTQIANIMKNKDSILAAFESNGVGRQARVSQYRDLNESLHKWYLTACSKGTPPSGPQITEKAKEIAVRTGKVGFKGTNGWLCKWKKRYNIHRHSHREDVGGRQTVVKEEVVSSETDDDSSLMAGDTSSTLLPDDVDLTRVREETGSSPTREEMASSPTREEMASSPVIKQVITSSDFSEILRGFKARDIYSLDETVCLWRALPHRDFAVQKCEKVGGPSEPRFTVAFLVNIEGDKESPVVIWKHKNPRCFRGFDKKLLPVQFFYHHNSWMDADIMNAVLQDFNTKLCLQNRRVLLLLDNASCHPETLQDKYSNIKIVFIPANAVSHPLDIGIRDFKFHYRQFLLRFVIAKTNSQTCAAEVVKSVSVLTAIRWVALAWKEVDSSSIKLSFMQAGVLGSDTRRSEMENFEGGDELINITWLISIVMGGTEHCSAEDYVTGDNNHPVCGSIDEEHKSTSTDGYSPLTVVKSEPGSEEESLDIAGLSSPSTFMEAIEMLEQVREFLDSSGLLEDGMAATSLVDRLAHRHISNLTQAAIEISLNNSMS